MDPSRTAQQAEKRCWLRFDIRKTGIKVLVAVFRWNVLLTEKAFNSEDIQLFVMWDVIHSFENRRS